MTLFKVRHELEHLRYESAGELDALGNDRGVWVTVDPLPVWLIAPGVMEEPGDRNRDMSHVAWTLYCPFGVDVSERDRIVHGAATYEVDGRPAPWRHPSGMSGTVVKLKVVEG